MNKFSKAAAFLKHLFDQDSLAEKAAVIVEAILAACSPRISEIAQHMPGTEAANYKMMIQRFLGSHPPTFYDATERKITLTVSLGEQTIYRALRYTHNLSSHCLSELKSEAQRSLPLYRTGQVSRTAVHRQARNGAPRPPRLGCASSHCWLQTAGSSSPGWRRT